jgi:uncharacterized LabA/DUF88 family protein
MYSHVAPGVIGSFQIEPPWGSFLIWRIHRAVASYAAFIDGGYLKAGGAKTLGKKTHQVQLDADELMAWIRGAKPYGNDDELMRAYWYDGEFDSSDPRHPSQRRYFDALDSTPGLEVRLGYLVERTPKWHHPLRQALKKCDVDVKEFEKHFTFKTDVIQKGVDALITLDLVHHSENHNFDWALLVAGDKDLVEAVWSIQDDGHHVVIAIPKGAGVAPELRRRADLFISLEVDLLEKILKPRTAAAAKEAAVHEIAEVEKV